MSTQRPDAEQGPPLAERVMHPDEYPTQPQDESGSQSADETTRRQPESGAEGDATTDRPGPEPTVAERDRRAEDEAAPDQGPRPAAGASAVGDAGRDADGDDTKAPDRTDSANRTETQVLPSEQSDDDEPTRVVPAVPAADADATRPMPAVEDDPPRSTDRDAARARTEARYRPADESYENLYAPAATAAPSGYTAPGNGNEAAAPAQPQVIRRIVRGKPTTDKFHGALALFILRLVVAAIMGVHGAQKLLNLGATRQFFGQTMIPYPEWAALATGIGEVLIAGALIIGLLVRVAGLGIVLIAVGALVFVRWAPFQLFAQNQDGFVGEKELLLAAVGLLFLLLGGGGWGADRMFRSAKSKGQVEEDEA